MMASAQVVKTSVNTNNSPSQDYTTNSDDHSNHNKLVYTRAVTCYSALRMIGKLVYTRAITCYA